MTLELPNEIILAIIEEIDEPHDLLSFALCNHVCKQIIIPHHLSFRHIRYGVVKASLWRFLVDRPSLIGRLRKLELVDMVLVKAADRLRPRSLPGRKPFLPYRNQSVVQLRDLIGEMFPLLVRLQRFVWMACCHPDMFNLLQKLGESSALRELHIAMALTDYGKATPCGAVQPNKPMTWNLRSVAIQVTFHGSTQVDTRTLENNIQTLLMHSPLLEDLYLSLLWQACPMIDDLLKSSRWPFLRRFTLGHDSSVATPLTHISAPTLARFFRAHPGLCSVAFLADALLPPGSIPPDALPALKNLILQRPDTAMVDVLPVEVARSLVSFHGSLPLQVKEGRSSHLLSQMTNLETCNLTNVLPNGRLLGGAIRGLSHLTRLFYRTDVGWLGPARWLNTDEEPIPELATLLSFKGLVHLSGPALRDLSPEDSRITALDLLVKNLPKLLFVRASFCLTPDTSWLKIVRPPYSSSSKEQTAISCVRIIRNEVQFIRAAVGNDECPAELDPERWTYFKGFDPFLTWRHSDLWT